MPPDWLGLSEYQFLLKESFFLTDSHLLLFFSTHTHFHGHDYCRW